MNKNFIAAVVSASAIFSTGVMAAEMDFPHIETTGIGEVIAEPDMAIFSVQVSETRKTAKEAKKAVDIAISAFNERLKNEGVARTDITSSNISLRPDYHYKSEQKPKLVGYRANRSVTVTVRDLDKLNNYLDGALGDGINNINNVELKISNELKFIELARQAAILDAKDKAQSLATGFGEKLDGVWKITYRMSPSRPVLMRNMAMDASAKIESSYQDSQIIIRDQVDVIFRLKD